MDDPVADVSRGLELASELVLGERVASLESLEAQLRAALDDLASA